MAYYNQAMLPLMGDSFAVSAASTGQIATATQLGYALGLLLAIIGGLCSAGFARKQ